MAQVKKINQNQNQKPAPAEVQEKPVEKQEIKQAKDLSIDELHEYITVVAKEYYTSVNLMIKQLHEAGKPTLRWQRIKRTLTQDIDRRLSKK